MWASLSFNEKPNTLSGWTWHCKLLFLNIYELEELILYSICWSDSLQVMAQFIDQKKMAQFNASNFRNHEISYKLTNNWTYTLGSFNNQQGW